MDKKIFKYLMLSLLALAMLAFFARARKSEREETKRLMEIRDALLKATPDVVSVTDSTYALEVSKLRMSVDELKMYNSNVEKLCESLNLKMKRIEAATTTSSVTDLSLITETHDTIIKYVNDTAVRAKAFRWNDEYVNVTGIVYGDSAKCNVNSYDTITQLVYRVPRKFLCFKFGTKAIRQYIYSTNPHTSLTYADYIEVQRE